jgi:predicted extracellular nuclease
MCRVAALLDGQLAVIRGVVMGDYQATDQLSGLFVEEEDADHDADMQTSEGIFVFAPSPTDVAEGDHVTVTGVVGEFFGLTQISSATVAIESSGNALPTAAGIVLPVPSAGVYESFEGMRVEFINPLYVSEYFELSRYGQIVLTQGGRVSQGMSLTWKQSRYGR